MSRLRHPWPVALGSAALVSLVVLAALLVAGRDDSPAPASAVLPAAAATTHPVPSPTVSAGGQPAETDAIPTPKPRSEPAQLCPFTGQPSNGVGMPMLVSIDNHPAARPQSFLEAADVVIEATVQGNTTRLTALYACGYPSGSVGPVRSGRFYHVDLSQEFQVPVIVYGAAPYTIDRFAATGIRYADGNTLPMAAFARSADRPAPYNVYLDLDRLQAMISTDRRLQSLVSDQHSRSPWMFAPHADLASIGRAVTEMEIRTNGSWRFGWTFDVTSGVYQRSDGGRASSDRETEKPLSRRTVIVQRVEQTRSHADPRPDADPPLHKLIGSGEGTVYVDGVAVDLRWSRPTAADATAWTIRDTGEPLVLPPGTIWWEIIPTTATLSEE